jgi:hypothetical protein
MAQDRERQINCEHQQQKNSGSDTPLRESGRHRNEPRPACGIERRRAVGEQRTRTSTTKHDGSYTPGTAIEQPVSQCSGPNAASLYEKKAHRDGRVGSGGARLVILVYLSVKARFAERTMNRRRANYGRYLQEFRVLCRSYADAVMRWRGKGFDRRDVATAIRSAHR